MEYLKIVDLSCGLRVGISFDDDEVNRALLLPENTRISPSTTDHVTALMEQSLFIHSRNPNLVFPNYHNDLYI